MLEVKITLHRQALIADQGAQKLFLALELKAKPEAWLKPPLNLCCVVDTSGSMREVVVGEAKPTGEKLVIDGATYNVVEGGRNKTDIVIEALSALLKNDNLEDTDRFALVRFDDDASLLLPFTEARERTDLQAKLTQLHNFRGGTQMGRGMECGAEAFQRLQSGGHMLLFTDGLAEDPERAARAAEILSGLGVNVVAIGVGAEWNEDLLERITDITGGALFHLAPDAEAPKPPSLPVSELPQALLGVLERATREVITNVRLGVQTVGGVSLERISRIQPSISELEGRGGSVLLGNIEQKTGASFLLELQIEARPSARVRIAQLGLSFAVPGAGHLGEVPPIDVVVEFTHDEMRTAQVDAHVMQFVQMRNLEQLVVQVAREAQSDPTKAQKTLELARAMTVRLGGAMEPILARAAKELESGKLDGSTAKTMRLGAKTQSLANETGTLPSEEEIRRLTGT